MTGISFVSPQTIEMYAGNNLPFPFSYVITPANATNKNVSWSVTGASPSDVVRLVQMGDNVYITADKVGTAWITVTTEDGNKTASVQVNVIEFIGVIKVIERQLAYGTWSDNLLGTHIVVDNYNNWARIEGVRAKIEPDNATYRNFLFEVTGTKYPNNPPQQEYYPGYFRDNYTGTLMGILFPEDAGLRTYTNTWQGYAGGEEIRTADIPFQDGRGAYTVTAWAVSQNSSNRGSAFGSFTVEVFQRVTDFRLGYVHYLVSGPGRAGQIQVESRARDNVDLLSSGGNTFVNDYRMAIPPVLYEEPNYAQMGLGVNGQRYYEFPSQIGSSPFNAASTYETLTVNVKPGYRKRFIRELKPANANFVDNDKIFTNQFYMTVPDLGGQGSLGGVTSPGGYVLARYLSLTNMATLWSAVLSAGSGPKSRTDDWVISEVDAYTGTGVWDGGVSHKLTVVTAEVIPDADMVKVSPASGYFAAGSRPSDVTQIKIIREDGTLNFAAPVLNGIPWGREEAAKYFWVGYGGSGSRLADYWICKYAVSQEQFEFVMGRNPSAVKGPKKSVTNVTYWDALEFCNKLSELEGFEPVYFFTVAERDAAGSITRVTSHSAQIPYDTNENYNIYYNANGYRLPSNVEWEWAAHAAGGREASAYNNVSNYRMYNGDTPVISLTTAEANFNSTGTQDVDTGSGTLRHMHGNVWEWTSSTWMEAYVLYPRDSIPVSYNTDSRIWHVVELSNDGATVAQTHINWPARNDARIIKGGAWNSSNFSFLRTGGIYYQHDLMNLPQINLDKPITSRSNGRHGQPPLDDDEQLLGSGMFHSRFNGIHRGYPASSWQDGDAFKCDSIGFRVVRKVVRGSNNLGGGYY